jgi:hypothetical protein
MTGVTPILAEIGSIEKVVITVLAVAGGFLIGFVLTNAVVRLLFKFVWKKQPPERVVRVLRFAGGVAAAILVYFLLTGTGGLGLGGGGGSDGDRGKEKQQGPSQEQPKQDAKKDELKPKDKAIESKGVLTVYLLRFDSPEKRFYRIGTDGKPSTLEEVLQRIDELIKNQKNAIAQVDIEAADPEYPVQAVSVLEVELNERGIKSTRPITKKSKN